MKKKIAFVSQFANASDKNIHQEYGRIEDESAAKRFGVRLNEEFTYWSWRACAIANIAMVLSTEGKLKETLYDLIREALLMDGYAFKNRRGLEDIGWKHDVLCQMLRSRGFDAWFDEFNMDALRKMVQGGRYVIASVKSKTGGHMVLVTNVSQDEITYHDPYTYKGSGGKNVSESLRTFAEKFRGRGVVAWLP